MYQTLAPTQSNPNITYSTPQGTTQSNPFTNTIYQTDQGIQFNPIAPLTVARGVIDLTKLNVASTVYQTESSIKESLPSGKSVSDLLTGWGTSLGALGIGGGALGLVTAGILAYTAIKVLPKVLK